MIMWEYQNLEKLFAKGYITKVSKLLEQFTKKIAKKNQKELSIESRRIKRKGGKLYVK